MILMILAREDEDPTARVILGAMQAEPEVVPVAATGAAK